MSIADYPQIATQQKETEPGKIGGKELAVDISDGDLADIIDKREAETISHNKTKLHLEDRRSTMEEFWQGKQFDDSKFYEWQVPYKNNLIYRDEETRISIISSRMPDIIVTPANQTTEKRDHARTLEQGLNLKINDDKMRRMVKNGLRQHDMYLQAALKCRWDKNIKDFVYEIVRPQKLLVFHTSTIPEDGFTSDNMEGVIEYLERPTAQVLAEFPNKRQEIMEELGYVRGTTKQVNSKMRYQEVWFSFYSQDGTLYEGVCWKLNKLIIDKQLNPYWDWEGYEEADAKSNKVNTVYRNHFDRPRKPYMFFTYQNLGKGPIDDTTHLEQAIPLQKVVNKRGRQITELADRSGPKLAFIADAMTKEDARKVSNDPDEHIILGGNVQNAAAAMQVIQGSPPSPALVEDLNINMSQIDAMFSTQSTTRGATVPQESGISKQITREGDLASHDDMAKVTVERVIFEAANWGVQMMKLFYDETHFVKDVGRDGSMVFLELKRDLIDEGIAVNVASNSVDKAQRRFDAQTASARRQIDPLSYWEDLDVPNPKERTRRLIAFLSGNFQQYYDMTDLAPDDSKDNGDKEAEVDIERLRENEDFEPPVPTPKYIQAFITFTNSDEYKKMPQKEKNRFKEFVKKLRAKLQEQMMAAPDNQGGMAQPGGQPPQPGQPPNVPPVLKPGIQQQPQAAPPNPQVVPPQGGNQ